MIPHILHNFISKTLILVALLLAFTMAGQTTVQYPASGNFIVPAGSTSIMIQAWGAGGAGGGSTTPTGLQLTRGGGGGGGGAYASYTFTGLTSSLTFPIVVGSGGSGVSGGNGGNGGYSTITGYDAFIKAAGGLGGTANTSGGTPAGGAGGTAAGSQGTTKTSGASGGNGGTSVGTILGLLAGSGGNGANSGGAGGNAGGLLNTSDGVDGASPGGGGSGSSTALLAGNRTGGQGGNGKVDITYTCSSYSLTGPNNATTTCVSVHESTVTLVSNAAGLPSGTYTVTYNTSSPSQTGLTATMTVATAGTGTFTATGLTTVGSTTITVTKLESGLGPTGTSLCSSTIASNNTATVTVSAESVAGSVTGGTTICSGSTSALMTLSGNTGSILKWQYAVSPFSTWTDIANTSTTYTSGNLTQTTQFRAVIQSGTCGAVNSTATTVTTMAPGIPTAGTPTQPSCSVATGSVSLSNLPGENWTINPGSISGSGSTTTINGLATGTYNFTVTNSSNCTSSPSSTVTINTAPTVPSVPTTGTVSLPDYTTPNSNFTITNYNAAYTYSVNPSTGVTVSGDTVTAPAGTYTVTATLGACTSAASNDVIVINNNKIWNGTQSSGGWFNDANWTPTGVPTLVNDVIIGNKPYYALISNLGSTDANCKTLTILSGGKLEADPNNTLTVTDKITVNTGGTFNLFSGASLIQTNNTANEGIINVYRESSKAILNDYTYWSSPTWGTQTLREFSANSNPKYFLAYDKTWSYVNPNTTRFDANQKGIGYAIIAPKGIVTPTAISYAFTGVPNNGNITVPVSPGSSSASYKLIGNPYPSALDAEAFITENLFGGSGTNKTISGSLYYWSRNTPLLNGVYCAKDYAIFNLAGGVPHSLIPQWIASGQGFIVETVAAGEVIFTNAMRTSGMSVNASFFKNANVPTANGGLEKNRIWLNFTNNLGANSSQALIGYIQTATNGYDPGFDGAYNNSGKTGMYSLLADKSYTIQSKALPFAPSDIVPLGYTTDIKGYSTISIESVDGLFADGQNIFIEDKLLKVVHNLKASPYIFSTEAGTFNSRFVLRYTAANSLGLDDFETSANDVTISSKNQQIKIQSQAESIDKVFVYDVLGREIYRNAKVNSNDALISDLKDQQILIIKVVLANGRSLSRKIAY